MKGNSVKLFEDFKVGGTYSHIFTDSTKNFDCFLYGSPEDDDIDVTLENLTITFEVRFRVKNTGLDDLELIVKKVLMNIKIETNYSHSGDISEEEVKTLEIDNPKNVEVKDGKFPLSINEMEVEMGKSLDPNNFKFVIDFGNQDK